MGWITVSGQSYPDANDNLAHALEMISYSVSKFDPKSFAGRAREANMFTSSILNKRILKQKARVNYISETALKELDIAIVTNVNKFDDNEKYMYIAFLVNSFKEEFVDMFMSNKNKFDKGNFTGNTIQFIGNVIEMLSEIIEEEKNKMQVTAIHEWLSDTSVFYSDALVFPSECISADYIALVCEEGYALLSRFDADNIFNFQGDVWGGRPKFFSEQATKKNRNKVLQTKKRNKKLDKIKTIENLQKKGRWI